MAGAKTLSRPSLTPRSLGDRGWGWRLGRAGAPGNLPSEASGTPGPRTQPPGGRQPHAAGPAPKLSEPRFSLLQNGDNNAARVRVF